MTTPKPTGKQPPSDEQIAALLQRIDESIAVYELAREWVIRRTARIAAERVIARRDTPEGDDMTADDAG